jgi:hypothetical protein
MIGTDKKRHRTVKITDPDLGCAGIEVEGAFFVDFALGVGRGKHFDTDFRCGRENKWALSELGAVATQPGDIYGFDSVCGRYGALRPGPTAGKELNQQSHDVALAIGVDKTWRRSHEDVSVPIGLDPVRKLRQPRVRHDFRPTIQIEPGLRLEIRELDRDRHAANIRQKWEKA